jgi:hypothetical protein
MKVKFAIGGENFLVRILSRRHQMDAVHDKLDLEVLRSGASG